ncbi:MAG: MoxR family ATPase [Candidatus Kapabacteria bacterium]|nr:MoxR family ATPase [Ignavibacteriota bacterium]MCW5886108.1 MoxR family ATPase [Candidatus Kapabacteria bacterium]
MSDNNNIEFQPRTDLSEFKSKIDAVKYEISKALIGNQDAVEMIHTALIAGGHILIEGVPGIAKTLMAKLTAKTLDLDFSRIQFTPDLMPSDITGTSVFNPKTLEFELRRGPIFSNIVLADEINRAPAKTQSALFEVMEERQVTIDGTSHKFPESFIVLATQNPIEQEGTYRLPEAQIDRFIFKILLDYPKLNEEIDILTLKNKDLRSHNIDEIESVLTENDLSELRSVSAKTLINQELIKYIAEIIQATRKNKSLFLGASPRGSVAVLQASKVFATISGRDFVTPEDILKVTYPALRHRIILSPEKEMEGVTPDEVISSIIHGIEVPR